MPTRTRQAAFHASLPFKPKNAIFASRGLHPRTNRVPTRASIANTFVLQRHGESKPNVRSLIVSRPSDGVRPEHGLTVLGRSQAEAAGRSLSATLGISRPILILSSDFSRAWETAAPIHALNPGSVLRQDARLRERFFGSYDGRSSGFYESVWREDVAFGRSGDRGESGAESVYAVAGRMGQVVRMCNSLYSGHVVVLVGHGDSLTILQTGFECVQPFEHRNLPHLPNGGMRFFEGSYDLQK